MIETIETAQTARTNRWTWLGMARIGAGGFVLWAVGLQLGSGSFDALVTVLGLVYLGFVRWLRRPERIRIRTFTAFASLTMAMNIVFGVSEFSYPESVGSFAPQLFVTLAITLGLLGGFGSLALWKPAAVVPVLSSAAVVLAIGVTVSFIMSAAAPSDTPLHDDVVVDARGFAWEPAVIVFDADESSGLWIENHDLAHHTLAVAELGLDVDIPSSKARRVDLVRPAAGEYEILCTVPGHESMTGTLVVTG